MISLDYDDLLMAAAGHQAEAALDEVIEKYKGQYILAVEGNPPLNEDGMYCIQGGKPFVEKLRRVARTARPSFPGARARPGAACRRPIPTPRAPRRCTRSFWTSPSSRCRAARPSPR